MKISIIGIGYVGIHSVVNLVNNSAVSDVVGFDINEEKILCYNNGIDVTEEVGNEKIKDALSKGAIFTNNSLDIKDSDVYIIAVPTDASTNGTLHLNPIKSASEFVGKALKENSIVVYESTVYPGFTEEICIPIIKDNTSFSFDVVYTPERVDPGNKVNTVLNTPRVISGTSIEAINKIIDLYSKYIVNMVQVSEIKVAESVKILENTQRDINIALMNNFASLMSELNVDFKEVLDAANTKWNFCNFTPGLVGGHCIGVDPYYLIHAMKNNNIDTSFIDAARSINENLLDFIENKISEINPLSILFVGATFKPNTNDFRNSKNLELANRLKNTYDVSIYDPFIPEYSDLNQREYDLIVFAVIHKEYNYDFLLNSSSKKINLTNTVIKDSVWNLM